MKNYWRAEWPRPSKIPLNVNEDDAGRHKLTNVEKIIRNDRKEKMYENNVTKALAASKRKEGTIRFKKREEARIESLIPRIWCLVRNLRLARCTRICGVRSILQPLLRTDVAVGGRGASVARGNSTLAAKY